MKVATNPIAKQLETFSNDLVSVDSWIRGYRLHSKDISSPPKGDVWG